MPLTSVARSQTPPLENTSTALHAKQRKAQQKVTTSRSKGFYSNIDQQKVASNLATEEPTSQPEDAEKDQAMAEREARMQQVQEEFESLPDVSTVVVDEKSGAKYLVQGKNVMDIVTRRPVQLSTLGPIYRLAQMFPGVPPDVRDKYRLDWNSVPASQVFDALRDACSVTLEDGTRGIPPPPSVSNRAIDFVLANRDRLGRLAKNALARITLRAYARGDEDAPEIRKLFRNYLTVENHISAPFRQMILDAEGRIGPNFGNLDVMSYCNGELYERCANYLVLKGMVAHWEKKVVDADYLERSSEDVYDTTYFIGRGDPRRYLRKTPIIFSLRECTQVCLMAQNLTKSFVDTPELFDDFPPEIKFLEAALAIRGGTGLRKFVVEEFCPVNSITPDALREGMRRLLIQLESLPIDPYGDLSNLLESLIVAMSKGSDEAESPFNPIVLSLNENDPGYIETYTFNTYSKSLLKTLDIDLRNKRAKLPRGRVAYKAPPREKKSKKKEPEKPRDFSLKSIYFSMKKPLREDPDYLADEELPYTPPACRNLGRPHELGWYERACHEHDVDSQAEIKPGRIIMEEV